MVSTRGGSNPKRARKRPQRSKLRRVIGSIFKVGVITMCVTILAGIAFVVIGYNRTELPDPNADFQTQTTFVNYRDGSKLGSLSVQNRSVLPYSQIPETIKDAVISAENRSFWDDPGISFSGILRSVWAAVTGGEVQGGSTITQQYIKVLYLNSERSFTRKIKEIFLAVKMSRDLSKEDILGGYLNTIYFGRGAYGIQAAARAFFNVDAAKLSVPQAAVLAAVLNNPSIFDPKVDPENEPRLLERYRYVLEGMAGMGKITQEQAATFAKALPKFPEVPTAQRYQGPNGFLIKMVEDELRSLGFREDVITGGGLRVTTTFDAKAQAAAIKVARTYTAVAEMESRRKPKPPPNQLKAAIASIDVETGGVLALYGGADYVKNSRNWAMTPRETGSTFKTFGLAVALNEGFGLNDTFKGSEFTPPGDSVTVRNQLGVNYGPSVTLREATERSINTAYVDCITQIDGGPQKVADLANEVGVPKRKQADWYPGSRLVLGTAEASAVDMANGYATFARDGISKRRHVISEVKSSTGEILYQVPVTSKQVVRPNVARQVNYGLSSVITRLSDRYDKLVDGRTAAGKTGTSGARDGKVFSGWFIGYTAQIATSVLFVVGDDGRGDLEQYKKPGDATWFGTSYPAQAWAEYTQAASAGLPKVELPMLKGEARASSTPSAEPTKAAKPTQPTETARPTTPQPSTPQPSAPPTTEPAKPDPTTAPPRPEPPSPPTTAQPSPPVHPPSRRPPTMRPPLPTLPTAFDPPGGGEGEGG